MGSDPVGSDPSSSVRSSCPSCCRSRAADPRRTGTTENSFRSSALTPSPSGTFFPLRKPATACSAMSMTSSPSRRPFGQPWLSPASTPSRFGFFVTGMLRLRRRTSASFGPVKFSFGTPVRRTATRSSRPCSGTSELVQLVDRGREQRRLVVLAVPRLLPRLRGVPLVLEAGRDDDLVDQRVAEPVDLDERARVAGLPAAGRDLAPVDGRPDADGPVLRVRATRSAPAPRTCGRRSRRRSPCRRPCCRCPCGSRRGRRSRRCRRRTDRRAGPRTPSSARRRTRRSTS